MTKTFQMFVRTIRHTPCQDIPSRCNLRKPGRSFQNLTRTKRPVIGKHCQNLRNNGSLHLKVKIAKRMAWLGGEAMDLPNVDSSREAQIPIHNQCFPMSSQVRVL